MSHVDFQRMMRGVADAGSLLSAGLSLAAVHPSRSSSGFSTAFKYLCGICVRFIMAFSLVFAFFLLCRLLSLASNLEKNKPKRNMSLSGCLFSRQVFEGLQVTDSSTTVVPDGPALAADICSPAGCCQQCVFGLRFVLKSF